LKRIVTFFGVAIFVALTACNGGATMGTSSTAASVSLSASSSTVTSGGSSTLSWSSSNTTSCTASNTASNSVWTGAKTAAASTSTQTLSNLTVTGTYTLTCTGNGGSASQSVTITTSSVINPTTVSLYARPPTVLSGEASTLTWSSSNATSCNASGAWSGSKATSGSQSTGALSTSQTYTLTCTGTSGTVSQSTIVTVGVPPPLGFVASVDVLNTSGTNQTNVPVTFGHAFKASDVPPGTGLSATLSDGTPIPLQLDAKATHPDHSLRHGIITLTLPSLAAGATQTVRLSTTSDSSSSGTPVSLSALLATAFDATVSLNVSGISGGLHSASAKEFLRALPTTIPAKNSWLSGQQVSEWIVGGPVKKADGTPHPHLTAYFHVRAYAGLNRVRVDTVIENNWTLVPGPQDFTYDVTLAVGGVTAYSQAGLTHFQHARWHKVAWWGGDPQLYAKLDTIYLQDSKAIPKYETLIPSEAFLNRVRQSTAPMSPGDQVDMDQPGSADGVGPFPRWDSVYAVSADRRAFNYMNANHDGAAAYPVHYRDEKTNLPLTLDSYPKADTQGSGGSDPVIPISTSTNTANRNNPGSFTSHRPSIGYLSYLVTGDYFYLEEMQFWASYDLMWTASYARGGDYGYGGNGATGIWFNGSLRGQAWAYRNIAQTASITPDLDPLKSYFNTKLANNLAYDKWLYVDGHGPDANNLGMMFQGGRGDPGSSVYGEYRIWYDAFISWSFQYLVDLGFSNAIPMRDYKSKTAIGMMGLAANESCFQLVPRYVSNVGPGATYFATFKEVYDATVPGASAHVCGSQDMANYLTGIGDHTYVINEMTGGQNSDYYYFSSMQPALAAVADSGLAGGTTAWNRSLLSGVHPDYRDMPIWAVIPRATTGVLKP
jgi:hypothetical protein